MNLFLASCCSRSSCSQCSDTECSSSEGEPSSPYQQAKLPVLPSHCGTTSPHASNDNYLTTDFNNPKPKTYRPLSNDNFLTTYFSDPKPKTNKFTSNYTPYIPTIRHIDLPKISILSKPKLIAPPLPFVLAPTFTNQPRFRKPITMVTTPLLHVLSPPLSMGPSTLSVAPPPLPVAPPLTQPPLVIVPTQAQITKKLQPKVQFSDTVTAFIVPEVKRPVRPPPPPHITDPQKELADSLPLCHPNEDYLKDFAPVIRNESEEAPKMTEAPTHSKIKVVHFGVV